MTTEESALLIKQAQSLLRTLQARGFPGLGGREELPFVRDLFGDPRKLDRFNPDATGLTLGNALLPLGTSRRENDPVARALIEAETFPGLPRRQFTISLARVDLTPEEYSRYSEIAGKQAYSVLDRIVRSSNWDRLPKGVRGRIIDTVFAESRDMAKTQTRIEFPDIDRRAGVERQEMLEEFR